MKGEGAIGHRATIILTLMLAALFGLGARECDQLTMRDHYESDLPDSLVRLNARTNELIGQAIADFNRRFAGSRTRLGGLDAKRYFALAIHNQIARESRMLLPQEEEDIPYTIDLVYALSKSGRGPLQEWLENQDFQGSWLVHLTDTIYHDCYPAGFNDSNIIKVAGNLVGTDKIDHFFDQGYAYWRISGYGRDSRRAIDYGVDSEWGWYGISSAGVFSYADLRANWAGYRFFDSLQEYYSIDSHQLMTRKKAFDWSDWVDPQWDELLNPSAITRETLDKIMVYVQTRDQNSGPDGMRATYFQTCTAILAGAGQRPVERTQDYLNDHLPTVLPTYSDVVAGVVKAGRLAVLGTSR